jgi:uncharacterized Tic20 family protein
MLAFPDVPRASLWVLERSARTMGAAARRPAARPERTRPTIERREHLNETTSADAIGAGTSEDRTLAILVHIGGLFTSWIAPLILFLIKKSEPGATFVTDQSREALNFQITVLIAYFACFILSFVLIGLLLFWVVALANLVLCVMAAIKASNGVAYRYPLTLRLIK